MLFADLSANLRPSFTILFSGLVASVGNVDAAGIIYSASFDGVADDTSLLGFVPDVTNRVPGAVFHESNNFWTANSDVGVFGERAQLGGDNQASLPIDSTGDFVKPIILSVSATINVGTTAGSNPASLANPQRGAGLVFFAGTGTVATPDNFRGLMITTDGRLIFAQHGFDGSPRAGLIEEIANGIDTALDHSLSFEIDTSTGDLSNILLNGNLQADVSTGLFASDINEVGFITSSSAGGTLGTFDDFTVTGIPEPGSLKILGLSGLLMACRRRR